MYGRNLHLCWFLLCVLALLVPRSALAFSVSLRINNGSPVGSGCSFSGSRVQLRFDDINGSGGISTGIGTIPAGDVDAQVIAITSGHVKRKLFAFVDGQMVATKDHESGAWNIGTFFGDACGTNCNLTYTAHVKNPNIFVALAYFKKNGAVQFSGPVGPGKVVTWVFTYCQGDRLDFGLDTSRVIWVPDPENPGSWTPTNVISELPGDGSGGTNYPGGGTNVWDNNFPPGFWDHFEAPWSQWATNGPIYFTNTSSTAARDDTLKAGFNATAKILQNMYDQDGRASAILANIERNTRTNVGGGGNVSVTNNLSITNNTEVSVTVTNIGGGSSNSVSVTITNDSGVVEYLETNKLHWSGTGFIAGAVAGMQAAATGAGLAEEAQWASVQDTLADGSGFAPSTDIGDWEIEAGSWTFDLNPLQGEFGQIAGLVRHCVGWLVSILFVLACVKLTTEAMFAAAAARQATSAGTTVLGTNANSPLALAMAAVITVAIVAIPTLLASEIVGSPHMTILGDYPLTGYSGSIARGIALADAFLPLNKILVTGLGYLAFRVSVGLLFTGVATIIRFMVGCIVFAAFVVPASAERLEFHNYTSTNCVVLRGTSEILARPGVTKMEWPTAGGALGWQSATGGAVFVIADPVEGGSVYECEAIEADGGLESLSRRRYGPKEGVYVGMTLGIGCLGFLLVMRIIRGIWRQSPEALG